MGYVRKVESNVHGFIGEGRNAKEAKANAVALAERVAQHHLSHTYCFAADGTCFCLYFNGEGWTYDIIHPDTPNRWSCPGSCVCGPDRAAALESMKRHAASFAPVLSA